MPGVATFYVLFSVMGGGISVLIRERREGTLARMATLPLRRSEIIGGKILARFITGILQFLIVFAVGVATGVDFGRSPLALILLMASYTLAITALGLLLGSRLKNEEQASLLTSMLAIVMAALGGAWWPLSIAPQFMQTLGRLTPVAWAMDGFQQLISRGGGLEDVLLHLAILSGFALVFFMLGPAQLPLQVAQMRPWRPAAPGSLPAALADPAALHAMAQYPANRHALERCGAAGARIQL